MTLRMPGQFSVDPPSILILVEDGQEGHQPEQVCSSYIYLGDFL